MRRMASSIRSSSFLERGSVFVFSLDEGWERCYDCGGEERKAGFEAHTLRRRIGEATRQA